MNGDIKDWSAVLFAIVTALVGWFGAVWKFGRRYEHMKLSSENAVKSLDDVKEALGVLANGQEELRTEFTGVVKDISSRVRDLEEANNQKEEAIQTIHRKCEERMRQSQIVEEQHFRVHQRMFSKMDQNTRLLLEAVLSIKSGVSFHAVTDSDQDSESDSANIRGGNDEG